MNKLFGVSKNTFLEVAFRLAFLLLDLFFRNREKQVDFAKEAKCFFLGWTLSFVATNLVTTVLKNLVGAHRPDFLNRCFPTAYLEGRLIPHEVGMLPECEIEARPTLVMEGRKSFPSGHSSQVWSVYFFSLLYFFRASELFIPPFWKSMRLIIPILTCLIPSYVSISRVTDYRHRPIDISAGTMLGIFFAFASFKQCFNTNIREKENQEDRKENLHFFEENNISHVKPNLQSLA
eukprot:GHVP01051491.1.p2 GENE.GHVP01051491.1~~GHVP01051491.1.p2  ORF type:complete len:234 (+),score=31.82 GHVP01051491.1:863-1564(+)